MSRLPQRTEQTSFLTLIFHKDKAVTRGSDTWGKFPGVCVSEVILKIGQFDKHMTKPLVAYFSVSWCTYRDKQMCKPVTTVVLLIIVLYLFICVLLTISFAL